MNIQIRHATPSDYENVIALYADFVNQPDRYKNLGNDSYHRAIKQPNHFMLLAEDDKRIIGFITFSIRVVIRYPRPIVEVEEFYVVPDLRREGIGTMLKNKVITYAKKKNCQYIFIASSKDRIPAHKFYKTMNFDEYAFHYRRKP